MRRPWPCIRDAIARQQRSVPPEHSPPRSVRLERLPQPEVREQDDRYPENVGNSPLPRKCQRATREVRPRSASRCGPVHTARLANPYASDDSADQEARELADVACRQGPHSISECRDKSPRSVGRVESLRESAVASSRHALDHAEFRGGSVCPVMAGMDIRWTSGQQ